MLILAIETSCDETSVAIISGDVATGKTEILSNIVSSQVKIHAAWGGVVPNLAAREHVKNITLVLDEALASAKTSLAQIDLIATTKGPGLIPALLIGTNAAKALSYFHQKPLLGVHHVEGHIYANFFDASPEFPVLCLVVSGGHTQLVLMKGPLDYEIIGQTLDDAAGEAFDKVAKILGLGYPGGPLVSKRAQKARLADLSKIDEQLKNELQSIKFPRPLLGKDTLDFSFSGLKTAVLYFYKKQAADIKDAALQDLWKDYICQAFEDAIVEVLTKKTLRAAKKYAPRTVLLAGGVAANGFLRDQLEKVLQQHDETVSFLKPNLALCGDNAAMIAAAAFHRYLKLKKNNRLGELAENWKTLEASANLKLQND